MLELGDLTEAVSHFVLEQPLSHRRLNSLTCVHLLQMQILLPLLTAFGVVQRNV